MSKQLLLSVFLAVSIVGGALWVADRSLKPQSSKNGINREHSPVRDKEDLHASRKGEALPPEPMTTSTAPAGPTPNSAGISKCMIDGKTVYSNTGCPEGARTHPVVLHDSAGIISPARERLADLTAKRREAERVSSLGTPKQVASIGRSSGAECEDFDRRVADLDSMARQPQSGTMQDWIKQERKAIRDRQFALRC